MGGRQVTTHSVTLTLNQADLEALAEHVATIVIARLEHERLRRYITVAQAAEVLGLTEHAIRHHIDRGHLCAIRVGGRVLVDAHAFAR